MIAAEADAIHTARSGRSLAEIMLARGAQLPRVAPRNVEQAVTKAEQAQAVVAEAEAITADAAPAAEVAVCTHAACLNAAHDECECACGGAGHGAATQVRATATRAKTQVRIDAAPGGIMGIMQRAGGLAPADEPF